MVLGLVKSGTVETGLYRVSPVTRAGLLDGAISTVGPTVLLKSGNTSTVLTVLLTVVKTVVPGSTVAVVESKAALAKSPVSPVLIKYIVELVSVRVVLIIRSYSVIV